MSRILRRPMFRGGRVSSYGTGIASGLADGGRVNYAGGGQIGGGIIYGKPMADGRYGFKKSYLYDVEDVIGETQTGATLGHLKAPDFQPIQTANEVAVEEAGEIDEVDTMGEEKEVGKSSIEKMMENDQWGDQDIRETDEVTIDDKIESYKKEGNVIEDLIEFTKKENTYVDEKGITRSKTTGKPVVRDKSDIDLGETIIETPDDPNLAEIERLKALLAAKEEPTELDAKTAVAENKKLFGELLGLDKARGQDISDMLIGASAKFLKPGATVKGGLGEFMEAESQRPSRRQKLQDTAAGLAIQDYVAGKRSKENIKQLMSLEDYKPKAKLKGAMPSLDDTASVALYKFAIMNDSKTSSDTVIKDFIQFKTKQPAVRNDKIKMKDLDNPRKQKKLIIGYNIIEEGGVKNIVKWDGTNYDIISLDKIWTQE
jgi:hypothetical protein